ncbi:hypothetical protein [Brazilian marseillevirus]|uniref:hypothetical protein n=1 Tax=Brazilian marseillevirus TaxID=1813599 RepID=UPI0007861A38|nr:hypothetical protein A3303_gp055 [Brazilian marseillevirus]AMQ10563.1 hypothetical protein [Brazilian marseillevirus]
MESVLLPQVYQLLREDFFVEKEDVVVTYKTRYISAQETLKVIIKLARNCICSWLEYDGRDGERRFAVQGHLSSDETEEALWNVRVQFHGRYSPLLDILTEKHKNILKDKEVLLERIEHIRQKKRELKYSPGKRGALEAQEHFEHLVIPDKTHGKDLSASDSFI